MSKNIKSIDFDSIKQNLIAFLKTQDKFSGYNFEASGMNILLDVLAYNAYYQMFYNNMVFNEMFLDTATKRSSVVSLAKMLGYTPASAKASTCIVNIITSDPISLTTIPKHTLLTANLDNEKFDFYTLDEHHLKPTTYNVNGSIATLETGPIPVKEGILKTLSFIHDEGISYRKYILPYDNIDVSTLSITVETSEGDSSGVDDVWAEGKDITKISADSLVYFLEEAPFGQYVIYFGDGVIGKRLGDGNKITATFLDTNGSVANGVGDNDNSNTFTMSSGHTIDVLIPSTGGDSKESKESIKMKAPKSFTAQERAVTIDDYKTIILKDFPNIKSVSCWGGEENDPPQYGKVFLSVKPQDGTVLTNEEKLSIRNSLVFGKNIVGIEPIVVDPEVIYILIDVGVKYDPLKIKIPPKSLINKINKQILVYLEESVNVFDGDFYSNELINKIDSSDASIFSINLNLRMEKRFLPDSSQMLNYTIYFRNSVLNNGNCDDPVISSSNFYYYDSKITSTRLCALEDDSEGVVNIVYIDELNQKTKLKSIGAIDYSSGKITLEKFQPVKLFDSNPLSIYALPQDKDIYSEKSNLIFLDILDKNSIQISVTPLPYRGRI